MIAMYFCYAKPKRKEPTKWHCYFECWLKLHHSRSNAPCDLSFVCQLQEQNRRFPKPRISTVFRRAQKNTSIISRKSTENRVTKRSFYKNDRTFAKSTVFGRTVPKEWDLIFYQPYRFQKMPKSIRPKIHICYSQMMRPHSL